jgi:5-methylcytosine-specific restriction endonuclease McrA
MNSLESIGAFAATTIVFAARDGLKRGGGRCAVQHAVADNCCCEGEGQDGVDWRIVPELAARRLRHRERLSNEDFAKSAASGIQRARITCTNAAYPRLAVIRIRSVPYIWLGVTIANKPPSTMNSKSLQEYLRHYGKIRSLRGSVIRSTFKRVTAAYDEFDKFEVDAALRELHLNPDDLDCVYCGLPANCWDHLIPAASGGTHQLRNLAPSCTSCNNRKGNSHWTEFFKTLDNSDEVSLRRKLLSDYTSSYVPGASLVTDPQDQKRLDELLDKIHKAMSEADEIVAKAIERKAPQ